MVNNNYWQYAYRFKKEYRMHIRGARYPPNVTGNSRIAKKQITTFLVCRTLHEHDIDQRTLVMFPFF